MQELNFVAHCVQRHVSPPLSELQQMLLRKTDKEDKDKDKEKSVLTQSGPSAPRVLSMIYQSPQGTNAGPYTLHVPLEAPTQLFEHIKKALAIKKTSISSTGNHNACQLPEHGIPQGVFFLDHFIRIMVPMHWSFTSGISHKDDIYITFTSS